MNPPVAERKERSHERTRRTALPILMRADSDGVATLTLNRPAQFNSLSEEMLTELQAALDAIAADAVGACRGARRRRQGLLRRPRPQADARQPQQGLHAEAVQAVRQGDDDHHRNAAAGDRPHPRHCHRRRVANWSPCAIWRWLPTRRKFAVSGVNLGLFCSTPSVALGRAMGRKQAMEMLLTGDFIDAAEAQRRGLVNRVVPLEQLDAEVASSPIDLRQVAGRGCDGQADVLQAARDGPRRGLPAGLGNHGLQHDGRRCRGRHRCLHAESASRSGRAAERGSRRRRECRGFHPRACEISRCKA
jgi:enoyl-CoA hydratase/carnithine racemase